MRTGKNRGEQVGDADRALPAGAGQLALGVEGALPDRSGCNDPGSLA
jgi:hypothetical protein